MRKIYFLIFLLCFSILKAEDSAVHTKKEGSLSTNQVKQIDQSKRRDILELIRLTSVQPEILQYLIPNIVNHTLTSLEKDAKPDEVAQLMINRILSDEFLEPYTTLYEESLTACEVKKLVDFFRSEESKKFNRLAPQVGGPIIAAFNQVARDILAPFPSANKGGDAIEKNNIINITNQNYEKVITESTIPIVIDIYSLFCPPCKALDPIFSDLSRVYDGKFKFAKLNVDEEIEISTKLGIKTVPTFLFIKDGKIKDQHVGIITKGDLAKKMDQFFALKQ